MKNIVKTLIPLLLIGCSAGVAETGSDGCLHDSPTDDVMSTGGTGGSSSFGTGSTNSSTGGSTDPACRPKTCDEVTYDLTGNIVDDGLEGSACGAFDDGCGRNLLCNPCNKTGFICGGFQNTEIMSYDLISVVEGTPNVCGGGCILQPVNVGEFGLPNPCNQEGERLATCNLSADPVYASEMLQMDCYTNGTLPANPTICCK